MVKLLIISGRSGSGKSTALYMLEDLGYYCVDNLPVGLLPALLAKLKAKYQSIAVSIDGRNVPSELEQFSQVIKMLPCRQSELKIIYLNAGNDILIKRFNETRRKHPLDNAGLYQAIEDEEKLLKEVASRANIKIDTSYLSAKALREVIYKKFCQGDNPLPVIILESFAYKCGIPSEADFIFDVRCLSNPYWEKFLRDKSGLDQEVIDYFNENKQVIMMYNDIKRFIKKWLPAFVRENRHYLIVAIGCTGGQHRSVYMVEKLGHHLIASCKNSTLIRHRELS